MFYSDRLRVGYVICYFLGLVLEWVNVLVEEDSFLFNNFLVFLEVMFDMFEYR